MQAHATEASNDYRAGDERHEQRGDRRSRCSKRYVIEDPQEPELLCEGNQEKIEHLLSSPGCEMRNETLELNPARRLQ